MKSFTLKFALTFLLGVGLASAAVAQKIGGTVKDSAGKPVVGASVIVEGSTLGASSGVDGQWSLNVPDASKKTLVISYIGMKTQRIAIGSKTQIDVTLEDESTALDDVVVVGYATVKRRDVVGSVASVNAETLQQMPVASVAEAMTGRMAGVQITATEGDPDAEIRIRVRGAGTFSSDGAPLYIVDGFPVESISDISSSEIQSIDILKDAFSTAIYGSRGANGVVLITTKSGEKGKVNVNYNVYWGFKDIARKNQVQALNPSEFAKWQYELAAIQNKVADNYEPYFGAFSDIDLYDNVKGNDWMDQLFGRTGEQFNHNLTVSGGGDKFKWNATYARLYDKAIMVGSNYSRDNLGLKTQFKPNKRVTLDFNIRYSRMKVRGAGANSLNDSGTQSTGRLKNAMLYTPIPLKAQIEGGDDLEENSSDAVMPTVAVSDSDRKRERTNWTANGGFTWEIVDDLSLKVEAGMEEYRQETNSFYGVTTYYSKVGGSGSTVPGTPSTNYNDVTRRRVRNTNTLSYDFRKLISNDNHHLNVLLGQEYIITEQRTFNTWGRWSARLLHRRAGVGLHGCGLQRQLFEHELCGRRHPALLFRTHQLRFQGQVHAFGHDARRRFVEVLQGSEMGLLPLGGRFVAPFGRVGDERPPVARQSQAALQLRYCGQQQHPDRHGRPDAALRGRHGQQLHLRRSDLLDAQRQRRQREFHGQCQPDVGDHLFA